MNSIKKIIICLTLSLIFLISSFCFPFKYLGLILAIIGGVFISIAILLFQIDLNESFKNSRSDSGKIMWNLFQIYQDKEENDEEKIDVD